MLFIVYQNGNGLELVTETDRGLLAAGRVGSWEQSWWPQGVCMQTASWSWDLIMMDMIKHQTMFAMNNLTPLHFKTICMCSLAYLPSLCKPRKALVSV